VTAVVAGTVIARGRESHRGCPLKRAGAVDLGGGTAVQPDEVRVAILLGILCIRS
jgi:hypothetical protein